MKSFSMNWKKHKSTRNKARPAAFGGFFFTKAEKHRKNVNINSGEFKNDFYNAIRGTIQTPARYA